MKLIDQLRADTTIVLTSAQRSALLPLITNGKKPADLRISFDPDDYPLA